MVFREFQRDLRRPHLTNVSAHKAFQVAAVLDDFSSQSFAESMNLWRISPDVIESDLECISPDFLFIESAWAGNFGTWKFKITQNKRPSEELRQLVEVAKELNIPTVFWNKEDPPHFEDFIETAKLFDYVFTTEEAMLANYRKQTEAKKLGMLRFAANPAIHNPSSVEGYRSGDIAFAGMYFKHKYPERREQIEDLFPPATKYGFDIYSRHAGGDARYQFPEPFDQHVVGKLPYSEMVKAYRRYKIFLNLNSVPNSKSMCARRVYELSAAKTAVVGMHTDAIRAIYNEDEVLLARTSGEVEEIYDFLLNDELGRRQVTQRAWRKTLSGHTYAHRTNQIAKLIGLQPKSEKVWIHVILEANADGRVPESALEDLNKQIFVSGLEIKLSWSVAGVQEGRVERISSNIRLKEAESSAGDAKFYVALFRTGFNYGKHYLNDLLLTQMQQNEEVVAKCSLRNLATGNEESVQPGLPENGWLATKDAYKKIADQADWGGQLTHSESTLRTYIGDPFGVSEVGTSNYKDYLEV